MTDQPMRRQEIKEFIAAQIYASENIDDVAERITVKWVDDANSLLKMQKATHDS